MNETSTDSRDGELNGEKLTPSHKVAEKSRDARGRLGEMMTVRRKDHACSKPSDSRMLVGSKQVQSVGVI